METTKKSSRKAKGADRDKILTAFRHTLLREGKYPVSVYTFCESIGIRENAFYEYFGSFDAIEKEIWKGYVQSVAKSLHTDKSFAGFSVREKILAFYFTLLEVMRADRSFVLLGLRSATNPALMPPFLKSFRNEFVAWLGPVLTEGKQNGEIARRPYLDERYDALFWLHLMFVLQFWSRDDSAGFEQTDAAIEKSVNLAFDLVGKGIFDNALDFGKFLYQHAKN
jgi:AcrR family transcriptional regulator